LAFAIMLSTNNKMTASGGNALAVYVGKALNQELAALAEVQGSNSALVLSNVEAGSSSIAMSPYSELVSNMNSFAESDCCSAGCESS
jgi:hypothetical protein